MAGRNPHPHVSWRDGRPRFQPGPQLRLEGFKGKNLKHDDGNWFTLDEAIAWSRDFCEKYQPSKIKNETKEMPLSGKYERGFIYFLWAGKAIKVGFSKNPFRRFNSLSTGIGEPVRLFVTVPGTNGDERRLHQRLASQKVRGEWFKASIPTLNVMRMVLNESTGIKGEQ